MVVLAGLAVAAGVEVGGVVADAVGVAVAPAGVVAVGVAVPGAVVAVGVAVATTGVAVGAAGAFTRIFPTMLPAAMFASILASVASLGSAWIVQ